MSLISDPVVLAPLLGSFVGLVLALTGAGGGILSVPLLVFGLNLSIQRAAPIGLLAVAIAAGFGALLAFRAGILRYRAAALIGVCGMIMAPLGVTLAQLIPHRPLLVVFALVLVWTAVQTLRRTVHRQTDRPLQTVNKPCRLSPADGRFVWNPACARALAGTGLLAGLLSGLLGVGGGFVIVPALARFTDLASESIIATSLGVTTLVSLGGIAAAAYHGSIDWSLGLHFAGGAISGLLIGRRIAARLAGNRLQQGFAVFCLLVALSLFARALAADD